MGLLERMRRRRVERAARLAEAEAAASRARNARKESAGERPEVHAVVARLRRIREQNHLAEAIERALRGGT
jgi:hypothetical protein